MASITITSNISDMDGGSGAAYAVCFQDSEFTDVANVDSTGRAAVIRYVMDHKDVADGPVVPMTSGSPPQFSATLTKELANVDTPPGDARPIDFGVTNHHAYVVTQSGKFENAFHVKHVPIEITGSAPMETRKISPTLSADESNFMVSKLNQRSGDFYWFMFDGQVNDADNAQANDKTNIITGLDLDQTDSRDISQIKVWRNEYSTIFHRDFLTMNVVYSNSILTESAMTGSFTWDYYVGSPSLYTYTGFNSVVLTATNQINQWIKVDVSDGHAENTVTEFPDLNNVAVVSGFGSVSADTLDHYIIKNIPNTRGDKYMYIMFTRPNDSSSSAVHIQLPELELYADFPVSTATEGWELLHRDIHGINEPFNGLEDRNIGSEDDFTVSYSQFGSWSTKFLEQPDYYSNNKYLFRIIPYLDGQTQLTSDNTERYIEWEQSNDFTTETEAQIAGFNLINSRVGELDSTDLTHTSTGQEFIGFYLSTAWSEYSQEYNYISGNDYDSNWSGIIMGSNSELGFSGPNGIPFLRSGTWRLIKARELYIWRGPKP